ncbi:MAG: outer membrane beta-barrel protein [Planctomycetota bacterium]
MKMTRWALAAALSLSMWGRVTQADEIASYRTAGAGAAPARASLSDDGTAIGSGLQAQPVAHMGAEAPVAAVAGADAGCGPNCTLLSDLGEPFKLFDGCFFQERRIQAGGWLAQSFTWNPYQPNDRFNGPMTWTDRSNEYQMNELYLTINRAADTQGAGWDYGYGIDSMYGTNYRWNTAAGLETNLNGSSATFYGAAIPQAYFEIAKDDVTVKMGHFLSPVGYFAVGTHRNFFPVLPYTFQYGEPFTHTGALATWKMSDKLSIGNGITRGWDNFDGSGNPNLGYLGTLNYTRDNGDTLAWVGLYGREPNFSGVGPYSTTGLGYSTRYLQTLTYTRKFSDNVTGVLQSDYGVQGDAVNVGGEDRTARWYGLNSYLLWNQTCRLQWGANMEWFRDEQGIRVGQVLPSFGSPDARGYAQPAGFDGSFYAFTFGPKYYLTPNAYSRVAFRADWYEGKRNGSGAVPFDDGTKSNQQVVVFDFVVTF